MHVSALLGRNYQLVTIAGGACPFEKPVQSKKYKRHPFLKQTTFYPLYLLSPGIKHRRRFPSLIRYASATSVCVPLNGTCSAREAPTQKKERQSNCVADAASSSSQHPIRSSCPGGLTRGNFHQQAASLQPLLLSPLSPPPPPPGTGGRGRRRE